MSEVLLGKVQNIQDCVRRVREVDPGDVETLARDPVAVEQMVLNLVEQKGSVTRADVAELCRLDPRQAGRLLQRLVLTGRLGRKGRLKATRYERS